MFLRLNHWLEYPEYQRKAREQKSRAKESKEAKSETAPCVWRHLDSQRQFWDIIRKKHEAKYILHAGKVSHSNKKGT
jgi:hypothetical protein